jgi:hypothetical protein
VFGVPLEELTGRLIDLHEAFGADARPLGEQIRDQPAWRQRFDVLDRFLLARLEIGPEVSPEFGTHGGG